MYDFHIILAVYELIVVLGGGGAGVWYAVAQITGFDPNSLLY